MFEAAARHLSFTKAAAELGMTQAAVSYQVKLLEERLGSARFLRGRRQLALSDTGSALARRSGTELFVRSGGPRPATLVSTGVVVLVAVLVVVLSVLL